MNEYFIDINIFMYAAGKPHKFKEPCVDILSRIQSGELKAAIDTEVFQEILYRYHHINLSDKGTRPGMEHDRPGTQCAACYEKGYRDIAVLLPTIPG